MQRQIDKIVEDLSFEMKDVLRAGLIVGWSMTTVKDKNTIINQIFDITNQNLDKVLQELMNFDPPLLERGPNGNFYRFSKIGSEVAKKIIMNAEPPPSSVNNLPTITRQYKGRGTNNKEMKKYAKSIGGNFVKTSSVRCNFCNHSNSIFVGKGGKLLCQECFKGGGSKFINSCNTLSKF